MIYLALLTVLVTTCTFRIVERDTSVVTTNVTNTSESASEEDNLTVQRCEVHELIPNFEKMLKRVNTGSMVNA